MYPFDHHVSGTVFALSMRSHLGRLMSHYQTEKPTPNISKSLEDILLIYPHVTHPSLLTLVNETAIYTDLYFSLKDKSLDILREKSLPRWSVLVDRLIERAPRRYDLYVPILTYYLQHKDYGAVESLLARIENKAPKSPLLNWFRGMILRIRDNQEAQGKALMDEAIQAGIGRFIPLPKE